MKRPVPILTPVPPPCAPECAERRVGCHAQCRKYLDWKAAHNALMREVRAKERIAYGLSERERASKRWRKK